MREPSEHLKIWEGHKHDKEEATTISGIRSIHWVKEFDDVMQQLAAEGNTFYLNENEHSRAEKTVETRDQRFNQKLRADYPLHRVERLAPHLHDLRFCKDREEIKLIKQAIEVTDRGFRKTLRMIKPGVTEFQVEAEWSREFISADANSPTPQSLLPDPMPASCIICRTIKLAKKAIFFSWTGACYANYNADLTRTVPVSGKFSRRQKQVYKSVLRVLRKSIANATVGKALKEWQNDSHEMMTEEMLRLKLITKEQVKKQNPDQPACRKFYMHGLGHSLGLDAHDVSNGQSHFKENSVFTVEPGIYLPEEGFGVRLEDNVQITTSGPLNLTSRIPIEAEEIEEIMNR